MLAILFFLAAARDWLGEEFARELTNKARAACGREFRIPLGKKAPASAIRALVNGEEGKEIYIQFLKDRHGYAIARVNEIYGLEATSFTELLTNQFPAADERNREVVADDAAFGEILAAHWKRAAERGARACGVGRPAQIRLEKGDLAVSFGP